MSMAIGLAILLAYFVAAYAFGWLGIRLTGQSTQNPGDVLATGVLGSVLGMCVLFIAWCVGQAVTG